MARVHISVSVTDRDGKEVSREDAERNGRAICLPAELLNTFNRYLTHSDQERELVTLKVVCGKREIWIVSPTTRDRMMPELERLGALMRQVQRDD